MNNQSFKVWDVIVIGGGPAGMMASARAAERGHSVLLLEKNARLGKKLSITGGGRCNVTNNKPEVRTMLTQYKGAAKFLFSTFTQHGVKESIEWFEKRGLTLHEENDGRLFPETNSAETICSLLASELKKQGVVVRLKSVVTGVAYENQTANFTITLNNGEQFLSQACVIASGGISRPETGATGEGFDWLNKLGHTVTKNNYSLVPVAIKESWVKRVSGVVLSDVKITLFSDGVKQQSQLGKILFTHFGISGPTVLNMSSSIGELLEYSDVALQADLFPKLDEGSLRTCLNDQLAIASNRKVRNIIADLIPKALITVLLGQLSIDAETPGHSLQKKDRAKLVKFLKHLPLTVKGLLGANKAVISSGGVSLKEVDFKTMESRLVPKLFVVGDVLDIDRPSGGYSLQLCWSTGWVAGNSV